MSKQITNVYNAGNLPYNNFNAQVILSKTDMAKVAKFMYSTSFTNVISKLLENPIDNVITLRQYPFNIATAFNLSAIVPLIIGNVAITNPDDSSNVISGYTPELSTGYSISIGTFDVTREFNSFMDFSPYTKYEIFLPYVGFIPLDTNEITGNTIDIEYIFDFNTGCAIVYLQKRPINTTEEYTVFFTTECKIAIDLPISGNNSAEIVKNNLSNGIATAAGVAGLMSTPSLIGQTIGVAALSSRGITNALNGNQVRYNKGQTGSGTSGMFSPQNAILIKTKPKPDYPSSYNSNYGKPSGATATLSELAGFTVIDSIHIEGLGATAGECSEIESLLKSGVIL